MAITAPSSRRRESTNRPSSGGTADGKEPPRGELLPTRGESAFISLPEPLLRELRDEIDVLRVHRPPRANMVVGIEGVGIVEIEQRDGKEAEAKLLEVDG